MKTTGIVLPLVFFVVLQSSFGQIVISTGPEITPEDMVENIVGEGIIYDNVQFQGADTMRGAFSNGSTTNLGLESGIFLCSGSGYLIPGPNNFANAGYNQGLGGHPSLQSISTDSVYDAAVLEFDFYPVHDKIEIKYIFGSEEYSEFVSSPFDDVCGILLTGPNPTGGFYYDKNINLIPDTSDLYVSISTVNNGYAPTGYIPDGPCMNCEYFIDNTNGLNLEYDGFTTVLTAWLHVVPFETYHIIIGIADVSDRIYDSGIFLKENSLTSSGIIDVQAILNPLGISTQMVEGCVNVEIIFELPDTSFSPNTLYWDLSESTADPSGFPYGDFEEEIPDSVVFEPGVDSVSISINAVADGIIEGEESLVFILENTLGLLPSYDTVIFYITDYVAPHDTISPPTVICEGCEADLWVNVFNGIPPYSYFWEPGGLTTQTITVSPDTTTTYMVTYTDMCMKSDSNSTMVHVIPVVDFASYYFEAAINPGLNVDVFGELLDDTVHIILPQGTNLESLIASFTLSGPSPAINVNGVAQTSGITPNDFNNPVTYKIIGAGGTVSEWVVIADIETGLNENENNSFTFFPNPAGDNVHLIMSQVCDISVVNGLGVEVFRQKAAKPNTSIDISGFEEGLYFLQIKSEKGLISKKLIISR